MQNDWESQIEAFTKAIFEASKDACEEGSKVTLERAKQLAPQWDRELINSLNRWDITEAISSGEIPSMVEYIVGPDEKMNQRAIDTELGSNPQTQGQAFLLPALELSKKDIEEFFASKLADVGRRN